MRTDTRILVLGPLAVETVRGPEALSGRRAQSLLAALVLSVNHAVAVDLLLDVVWPEGAPASGVNALQSHVSRLRQLLGDETLVAVDHSYTLVAGCDDVDSCVFERLVIGAAEMVGTHPSEARDIVRRALAMWRGPAYGELAERDPFRIEALRLEELRRTAVELELECDVELGDAVLAIARLRSALVEDPYREHLWLLLVKALAGLGRRVDALEAFDDYCSVLAELGLRPDTAAVAIRDTIRREPAGEVRMETAAEISGQLPSPVRESP